MPHRDRWPACLRPWQVWVEFAGQRKSTSAFRAKKGRISNLDQEVEFIVGAEELSHQAESFIAVEVSAPPPFSYSLPHGSAPWRLTSNSNCPHAWLGCR